MSEIGDGHVVLTARHIDRLLGSTSDLATSLSILEVLVDAGWTGAARAAQDALHRASRDGEDPLVLLRRVAQSYDDDVPEPLAGLLVEVAVERGDFEAIRGGLLCRLDSFDVPRHRLLAMLDRVVKVASEDVHPDNSFAYRAYDAAGYSCLYPWLEAVAPVVFPDVRDRLRWFLDSMCPVYRPDRSEYKQGVTDVVLDWWRLAGPHQAEVDQLMLEAMGVWRPLLDWDYAEAEVADARSRLGLPRHDEEVDPEADE